MSKSLIRKNQLHPDVSEIVGEYGSGYFSSDINTVHITGDQTISGVKNFVSRPTVSGTGVLLSGEAVSPLVNIENITTNFNFTKDHNSKLLKVSGDQNIITGTLPLGLDTGYNVSFVQMGTKEVCITGVNGITIEQKSNFNKTDGKYSIASLVHHGNNQYLLYGDLA